ncbi:hypothetical protein BC830DRAFT_222684 [Chytriomyces sp. MP71]|nr:hypothetical protein BC830DRAFT_222684 [Chytriomyces sp. MP71]
MGSIRSWISVFLYFNLDCGGHADVRRQSCLPFSLLQRQSLRECSRPQHPQESQYGAFLHLKVLIGDIDNFGPKHIYRKCNSNFECATICLPPQIITTTPKVTISQMYSTIRLCFSYNRRSSLILAQFASEGLPRARCKNCKAKIMHAHHSAATTTPAAYPKSRERTSITCALKSTFDLKDENPALFYKILLV